MMNSRFASRLRLRSDSARLGLLGLIGLVILTGCQSPRRAERTPPPPPQPRLAASQSFFDGAITVSAVLEAFHFQRPAGSDDDTTRGEHPPRPERGPGGGMGGPGGPPPGGGEGSGGGRGPGGGGGASGGMARGPLRQQLVLSFANTSEAAIQLRIAEVTSPLGSFVPEPEILTLEPGASQTIEPFRAGYPENFSELHLKLRLRTLDANETHTLILAPAAAAASPAGKSSEGPDMP